MRLINNSSQQTKGVIFVRHGEDLPILTVDLNQPLTKDTKKDILQLGEEINRYSILHNPSRIKIYYSTRLRGVETAELLKNVISSVSREVQMLPTEGIREIYQGKFEIKDYSGQGEYKLLVEAWKAWQEQLDACELLYRFGDPLCSDLEDVKYPYLLNRFSQLGEHQGSFSLRLYIFLAELFSTNDTDSISIVVGHQATCSRMQRALYAAINSHDVNSLPPGHFVRYNEKLGKRTTVEHAAGVVVDFPDPSILLPVLQKEIAFLKKHIQDST